MVLELGYYFPPDNQLELLGPGRLEVNLYHQPTERHFDPENAVFLVVEPDGEVKHVTLVHPWHGPTEFRVCTGRITLGDRRGKTVQAFSLGGNLEITGYPDHTHCILTSAAPIAELAGGQTTLGLLVTEFEALLARKQAEWGRDEAGFRRRLATIDPLTLLAAGLAAVQERLKRMPLTESQQRTSYIIHRTIHTLQQAGHWPAVPPSLDNLFQVNHASSPIKIG
jgi:hypothetical protein